MGVTRSPSRFHRLLEGIEASTAPGTFWELQRDFLAETVAMVHDLSCQRSVTIGEYLASLDFPQDDLPNLDVATIHSLGLAAGRLSSMSLKFCANAGVGVNTQSVHGGAVGLALHTAMV